MGCDIQIVDKNKKIVKTARKFSVVDLLAVNVAAGGASGVVVEVDGVLELVVLAEDA